MDQELKDILGLILSKVDNIEKDVKILTGRMEALEGRMEALEGRMEALEGRMEALEGRMEALEKRVTIVEDKLDETNKISRAIEHSNQVYKAEMDNIKVRASESEGNFKRIKDAIKAS